MKGHLLQLTPLTGHLPGHPHSLPPWPLSVYAHCSSLAWQEVAGLGSKGQVPCSCSRAIAPEPHSSWPTDCGCHSTLPGLRMGGNTGTKRKPEAKGRESLDDAIAISPQVGTKGSVFILAATISMFTLLYWLGIPGALCTLCLLTFGQLGLLGRRDK